MEKGCAGKEALTQSPRRCRSYGAAPAGGAEEEFGELKIENVKWETLRGVVFDLDGTLVDAFGDIAAAVNHGLAVLDLPTHSVKIIRSFVGNGVTRLAERALGPDHADLAPRLAELLVEYYRQHPADHARPYPGAVETLDALRRGGLRIAVLSNKRHELSALVLDRLGLTPRIDLLVGEGAEIGRKPDPRGFLQVAEEFGVSPEELLMVGDGEPDALVARNVGAPFVGVSWGLLPAAQLTTLGARTVLHDLRELPPLLGLPAHGFAS